MLNKHNNHSIFVLLMLSVSSIPFSVWGQMPEFYVICRMIAPGGTCESGHAIAGSLFHIIVSNKSDIPLEPLKDGWPEGYILEASLDPVEGQPFVPTPGLIQQLEPTRFINSLSRGHELRLANQDGSPINAEILNFKDFMLRLPPNLAGHGLSIRCLYNKSGANAASLPSDIIRVVAPCSRADTARILSTEIYYSKASLEYNRGIEIADSMLQTGLSDEYAWSWAQVCAKATGHPEKKLAYMDKIWADFGIMDMLDNSENRFSSENQKVYERKRGELLQMIEHRQQQQH